MEKAFEKISFAEAKARIEAVTTKKNQEAQRLEERYIISMAHYQLIK